MIQPGVPFVKNKFNKLTSVSIFVQLFSLDGATIFLWSTLRRSSNTKKTEKQEQFSPHLDAGKPNASSGYDLPVHAFLNLHSLARITINSKWIIIVTLPWQQFTNRYENKQLRSAGDNLQDVFFFRWSVFVEAKLNRLMSRCWHSTENLIVFPEPNFRQVFSFFRFGENMLRFDILVTFVSQVIGNWHILDVKTTSDFKHLVG